MRRNFTAPDLGLMRHFDPRNASYLVSDLLAAERSEAKRIAVVRTRGVSADLAGAGASSAVRATRPDIYRHRHPWEGDQGPTPRCTGFSGVKAWLAGPTPHNANDARVILTKQLEFPAAHFATMDDSAVLDLLADLLYRTAVEVDRSVHGLYFDGGATMLALGKAGRLLGMWSAFYWGYSLADFVAAHMAGYTPILGIWWRAAMDSPLGKKATIVYEGSYRGGHAITSDGYDIDPDEDAGRLDQTWGRASFGNQGYIRFPVSQLERAIADDGEVLVVVEKAA